MAYRIDKLEPIAKRKEIDAFILTTSISVKYLCGYFYNFEIGLSPFQLIPAALFIIPSKLTVLIIADNETDQLPDLDPRVSVSQYASYTYEKPLDFSMQFLSKLKDLVKQNHLGDAMIGVESDCLPFSVAESLTGSYPKIRFINISKDLIHLRMIKEKDEINMIREATHLCDIGQEAVIKYAKPGMTELELFTLVRGDMDSIAGKRVPMMADLVCGARTFEGGGNPSSSKIVLGDFILSDLTPCLNGYWGDTCNTIVIGKPGAKQIEHFNLVREALEQGINAIKPGVYASSIDHLLRKHLSGVGNYGHHSGHGVGLAYHEEPRIVPYNNVKLAPNMIIALEPAIYINGYGIRLEHLMMVTESGCEIISEFNHRFNEK